MTPRTGTGDGSDWLTPEGTLLQSAVRTMSGPPSFSLPERRDRAPMTASVREPFGSSTG